ncbi:hypothetical protein ALMP_81560 [Streptomyces sp. A012304]|nr:hypothetical protein ALMP_81560 [Streptomyces sp. A012304]
MVGDGVRAERVREEPEHRVAHGRSADPGTDLGDHAGAFAAHRGGARVHVERDEDVPEVEARGPYGDADVVFAEGPSLGVVVGEEGQAFQGAGARGAQGPVAARRHQLALAAVADVADVVVVAAGPGEPGCQRLSVAEDQLRLAAAGGCLEQRRGVGAVVGVDQRQPAGVLALGRAHQPPYGRVDEVGHRVVGRRGHRAVCHDHQRSRTVVAGEPLPHLPQDVGGRRRHRVRQRVAVGRGERGAVEDREPAVSVRPGRPVGEADRHPAHVVERSRRVVAGGAELLRGHRAQRQLPYADDGSAGAVDGVQGEALRAGDGQAQSQGAGAGGQEDDVVPGERQPHQAVLRTGGGEFRGVQGRVEQGRVEAEPARGLREFLGERDFGVHVVVEAPGGAQRPERGPVAVSVVGEFLVEAVEVDGPGAGRGPGGQAEAEGVGGPVGAGGPVPLGRVCLLLG